MYVVKDVKKIKKLKLEKCICNITNGLEKTIMDFLQGFIVTLVMATLANIHIEKTTTIKMP